MDRLLLEVQSLWLLGIGSGLGNLHHSETGVLGPPSPGKWQEPSPPGLPWAEVGPKVAAGPVSSPTSVAKAASLVTQC